MVATVLVSKDKLDEMISVARSINRGKSHEIRVPGDDEPCYLQRKEWVDWAVTAFEELVEDVARLNGNSNIELATGQQGSTSMDTVKCFRFDQWLDLTPDQLEMGDQFTYQGKSVIVTGQAYLSDGKWHIPAQQPEPKPIHVDLSGGILAQCMDFAGTGVVEFPDGTAILADLEWAPGFVYSPRLPKAELEAFCTEHRERYAAFFDANQEALLQGESVAMEPWWPKAAMTSEQQVEA